MTAAGVVGVGAGALAFASLASASTKPPAAKLETGGRVYELQGRSACWRPAAPGIVSRPCVDRIEEPTTSARPVVVARRFALIHFRLPFEPTKLMLRIGGKSSALPARSFVSWRITGCGGPLDVRATASRGEVTYQVTLRLRPACSRKE